MRRVSAALCFALVALGGCVTPSPPAGPRRALPLARWAGRGRHVRGNQVQRHP